MATGPRGGSRAGIYPFLHRNGRRAAQGPEKGPQKLKDGNGRKDNGPGLFSVKSHDRGGAAQPPPFTLILTEGRNGGKPARNKGIEAN